VAGLLIARASAREREIAVRLSIGAGRMQVVRQMLTESLLLGAAAGAAGVVLAFWSRSALLKMFAPTANPITMDIGFDARVFTFAIGVSIATGVACGIFPAIRGTRVSLAERSRRRRAPPAAAGRSSSVKRSWRSKWHSACSRWSLPRCSFGACNR
jgi:ABC-type antimicrobial peptide transport system permease subunit